MGNTSQLGNTPLTVGAGLPVILLCIFTIIPLKISGKNISTTTQLKILNRFYAFRTPDQDLLDSYRFSRLQHIECQYIRSHISLD